MSSNAGAALVAATLLAGCPGSQTVVCDNGVICPEGLVCTENATSRCGQPLEVQACRDENKDDLTPCSFATLDQGVCRGNVCVSCTTDLTGCSYPQWVPMTSVANNLRGIWVAGRAHAYAIGHGVALVYDGVQWKHIAELEELFGGAEQLFSIWGISEPLEIFVAGSRVFHYQNRQWSVDPVVPVNTLSAIGGASRTNVLATGLFGEAWKYDGTAWSNVDPGASPPDVSNAIWFAGPNDAFIAGGQSNAGVVRRFDGTTWSPFHTATDQHELKAVWGTSANDMFVAGISNFNKPIGHFTGTWQSPNLTMPTISELRAIWGTTSMDVFAAGIDGAIFHSDGDDWTAMPTPGAGQLTGIHGSSSSDVFAVGETGEIWHYTAD